ncbi:CocE/NonD family hydrolase [Sphingomonas hengshuiensis]|uniref:Glutaryl-7-ACA acylase n=1 Tax=Sphingomonas hengshuiensis TaxID=1609977 RepID=A0A7U5CV06_9SPHN|nr:CocE/NonD family hydrolase [Sphingomonas hengshuiensis]AJP74431.1 glutaryl-7-ACA acylase [Sphingomonas hengshuiensis]
MKTNNILRAGLACAALATATFASAQDAPAARTPGFNDIPEKFVIPAERNDYIRREVMIPMRDGTKLFTVLMIPKGAKGAPILLTRTPYNAAGRTRRMNSPQMLSMLPEGDEVFVKAGYIRVFQDVRGKNGSEGEYVVTRPPVGPLNPTKVDHTTDAWDTIDWLVKNTPESNGKVGMLGSSYEGFTVVMALLNPHPALKVAAPESPMIDGWMGDDWFHHGAFRLPNIGWISGITGYKAGGPTPPDGGWDDYDTFRKIGSAGDWAKKYGYDQLPFWQRLSQHVAYDAFWQGQALDKLLAKNPSNVPTLWEQGLWDHEDMYGAIHSFEELQKTPQADKNFLLMGPWRHSGFNYDGSKLGDLAFEGDTALQARRDILLPFFNAYLKDGAPAFTPAKASIYNSGENHWDYLNHWPLAPEDKLTPLYLGVGEAAGFAKPGAGQDSYVSDPAKPVPHLPRPINFSDGRWSTYLVTDQRFVDGRTDVLTYSTEVLTEPVRVSGAPLADIFAKTTGTDGDFVVKVIDVYPDEMASKKEMGGFQLPIAMDIFRGRYRNSFEKPSPIPANKVQEYKFRLPTVNHTFLPGHRIMVQIQSSQFPVYDRNPQKYVENIFFAKPEDYQKATVSIVYGGAQSSAVLLPVVPVDQTAAQAK